MIKRRGWLRRGLKPIPKRRKTPRVHKDTVRLTGKALQELRRERWEADGRKCTAEGCGVPLPLNGDVFTRAHLAHIKSRGAGGGDTFENTRTRCFRCHIELEHIQGGGKPCPAKELLLPIQSDQQTPRES